VYVIFAISTGRSKSADATASRPPDLHYSKLHFNLESAFDYSEQREIYFPERNIYLSKIYRPNGILTLLNIGSSVPAH
jgi:hypothetical protein